MLSELDIELLSLNEQQKLFCEEYVIDFNATRAAKQAGYAEKSAKSQASRLLTLSNTQEYIQHLLHIRTERTRITADKVVEEIAKVAFLNVEDFYDDMGLKPLSELDENAKAAISSYQTKRIKVGKDKHEDVPIMKVHDKMKALELLGKHVGAFEKDNAQKQPINQNINVSWE